MPCYKRIEQQKCRIGPLRLVIEPHPEKVMEDHNERGQPAERIQFAKPLATGSSSRGHLLTGTQLYVGGTHRDRGAILPNLQQVTSYTFVNRVTRPTSRSTNFNV